VQGKCRLSLVRNFAEGDVYGFLMWISVSKSFLVCILRHNDSAREGVFSYRDSLHC